MRIFTFDTTLRDGTQGEAVSLSVDDKLLIARKLDDLGIDYIEGGWPGSNPKDKDFFTRAQSLSLRHARLTAFGATRLARYHVDDDPSAGQRLGQSLQPLLTLGQLHFLELLDHAPVKGGPLVVAAEAVLYAV